METENQENQQQEQQKEKKVYDEDFVSKLMNEKKNAMAKIKEYENTLESEKTKTLQEQNKFKDLYENSLNKIKELETNLSGHEKFLVDSSKKAHLKAELEKNGINPSRIDVALKLVDLNEIKYDQENKIAFGADVLAKSVKEIAPELFGKASPGVNNSAPEGNKPVLSIDAFKTASPEEKKKQYEALMRSQGIDLKK